MRVLSIFFLLILSACHSSKELSNTYQERFINADAYYNYRYEMMKRVSKSHYTTSVGDLDSLEQKANLVFVELCNTEKDRLKDFFPPSKHFCEVRKKIELSPFFDLVQKLPKGAMTRGHMQNIGDYKWLLEQAFENDNAFVFVGGDSPSWINHSLHFFDKPPSNKWRSLKSLNIAYDGAFIDEVYALITLGKEEHPYSEMTKEYSHLKQRVKGLLQYRPLFRDYVKKIFEGFISENIQYVEIHSSFNGMYDLKRSYFNPSQEMDLYVSIRNEIRKEYPQFDFKVIYSLDQSEKEKSLKEHYEIALDLYEQFPDVFGGFDFATKKFDKAEVKSLVGQYFKTQEDPYYAEMFLPLFFNPDAFSQNFHEGIYDAILLNAQRVGYGLELYKHPELMALVKEKGIAIEISPISDQAFQLVPDLQKHPVEVYMNNGIPFILGSEKQGVLKHSFSHQFYEAILAWNLDLIGIKYLIQNSIKHSLKDESEKTAFMHQWSNQWTVFLQDVINNTSRYKY